MTTQGGQSSGPDIDGSSAVHGVNPTGQPAPQSSPHDVKHPSGKKDWTQFILYAIAAVAAIGLVTTLVGVFLVKNDTVTVAGALTVSASASAWIVGAITVLIGLIARRFKSDPGEPPQRSHRG